MEGRLEFKDMTDYEKSIVRAFRRIDKLWRKGKPRFSLYSSDKFVALTKRGNVVEAFSNINKEGYCYE